MAMETFIDQTGRDVDVIKNPQRIISLVPSQTELLYDLGLEERVVGITKFCIHPDHWFRTKKRVGGTKTIRKEIIDELHPDLIIANKEENVKEQVEELSGSYPVWISDINTLEDSLWMTEQLGKITGSENKSIEIINNIREGFNKLSALSKPIDTCYFIWKDPYMTVGSDTFINDILKRCGFRNVFEPLTRYPEISIEDLQKANPQLILLSSEPYPFKEKNIEELQSLVPNAQIMLADGEMFSWYGSRLIKATKYLSDLISFF